ncbi:hypothetical protein UlMin_003453 [Ulmus minor]
MDSHQLFGIGVTSASISYTASHSTVPTISNRLLSSLKFDIGNSPNSPFTTHFDSDTLTTLSDSQEQLISTENLSGISPSCNYPPVDCLRDSLHLYSGRTSVLQDATNQNFKNALQKLETSLIEPDEDEVIKTMPKPSFGESSGKMNISQRSMSWRQERQGSIVLQRQTSLVSRTWQSSDAAWVEKCHKSMEEASQSLPPDNLKQLLIACAKALNDNNYDLFDKLIEKARGTISICGDPIQHLGAYMVEGMVARKQEPESKDLLSYMQILYEICPYLKFGYMAANGAIAEACKKEDRIHIIDFQIAQGTQWMTLLQALVRRPSGAPHVRITGIDDPVNQYARGDGLVAVGRRLAAISQNFNIPVEFNPVLVFAPDITLKMLDLHHTPDGRVDVNNPRDELLRMVKSLSPKVVTLVEQESNTNTTPFFHRFVKTLDYYLAMFESIDVTLPRNSKHKINVEHHCLVRDIGNLFGKWKSRLTMAGFKQYPLSSYVNLVIRSMLKCYLEHYKLVEKDGAMLLGWK